MQCEHIRLLQFLHIFGSMAKLSHLEQENNCNKFLSSFAHKYFWILGLYSYNDNFLYPKLDKFYFHRYRGWTFDLKFKFVK